MNTTTLNMPHRKAHILLTLSGLTGIVSLFLPFTFDVSPLYALQEHSWWKLAAPFFLSVLVFVAAMRWIISGSFTAIWKAIVYFISVASAMITISFFFAGGASPSEFIEWSGLAVAVVVLLSGSWLVISKLIKQTSDVYCPLIALQVAYLANCLMCLVIFFRVGSGGLGNDWQIGAWLSLITVIVYLLQIFLFATQRDKTPDRGHETERGN